MVSNYAALKRENEARRALAEREGRFVVDAWPSHMVFEFTAACNLQCFMCGYEMLRDDMRALGRTNFTLPAPMLDLVAKTAFPHIQLINPTLAGEPFVLPYFDALVDAAAAYECKLDLFTNGMLLRGDRLRTLMPHLGRLTVSFDGATKATFEYVRTGANFEQVLQNVEDFATLRRELGLENQIEFNFNVTLLRENVHELPEIIEIAARNDVGRVTAGYVIVMDERVAKSSPMHDPVETNRALAAARARAEELALDVRLPQPLPLDAAKTIQVEHLPEVQVSPDAGGPAAGEERTTGGDPPGVDAAPAKCARTATTDTDAEQLHEHGQIPAGWQGEYYCDMPWQRAYVGLGGEVSPCCSPSRPIVGNAFEQDFLEIWNGDEYRELREGLFTGDLKDYCRRCPFLQEAGKRRYEADGHMFGREPR